MSSLNPSQPSSSNTFNKDLFTLPPLRTLDSDSTFLFNQKPPNPPSEESIRRLRTSEFDHTLRKVFPEEASKQENTFKPKSFEDNLSRSNLRTDTSLLTSSKVSTVHSSLLDNTTLPMTRTKDTTSPLFGITTQKDEPRTALNEASETARLHSRRPITLPFFLCDSNNPLVAARDTKPSEKRLYEDTTETRAQDNIRNVAPRCDKGVFASSNASPHGFFRALKKVEEQAVPKESIFETGIPPSRYMAGGATLTSGSLADQPELAEKSDRIINKNKVRIFGFHPDEANQVIQFFSNLGELLESPHCENNLIVLHYQTPEAAAKAIECNGTVFNQGRAIGVTYNDMPKDVRLKVHDSGAEIYHPNLYLVLKDQQNKQDEQQRLQKQQREQQQQQLYLQQQNDSLMHKIKAVMFGW